MLRKYTHPSRSASFMFLGKTKRWMARQSRSFPATARVEPEKTKKGCKRNPVLRFLNPWVDVAYSTPSHSCLGSNVAQYTETWGLVSVLLCGLSLSALVGMPHTAQDENISTIYAQSKMDPCTNDSSPYLLSLLCGDSRRSQHDAYILSCTSAFFAAASSLGLSTVLNVIVAVTPNAHLRDFVFRHSWHLCVIPCLTAVSGGLVGLAIAIGVDWSSNNNGNNKKGMSRISQLVFAEFVLTTLVVSLSAISGQVGLFRALSLRNGSRSSKLFRNSRF